MVTTQQAGHCGIHGCTSCKPNRVAHWQCAQCGGGPYKFSATDKGPFKVLRPHFERTGQRYVTDANGVGRYEYTVRRVCSAGCWQRETRRVVSEEHELADKRPDLAPAIHAKHEAEQDASMDGFPNDDLTPPAASHPGSF